MGHRDQREGGPPRDRPPEQLLLGVAAITTFAARLGTGAETLRKWVPQSWVATGQDKGVTTEQAAFILEFRCKNAELERTIAILRAATIFFARESDPRPWWSVPSRIKFSHFDE